MASEFEADTAGCVGRGDWLSSGFCNGCGGRSGLSGIFPTAFVSYLNNLPSEAWAPYLALFQGGCKIFEKGHSHKLMKFLVIVYFPVYMALWIIRTFSFFSTV